MVPERAALMAPPWLLLRGLSREVAHWGGFPAQLQRLLGGVPVHCLDLPGAGALHRVTSPTSIPAIVEHCRMRLPGVESGGPRVLLGLSMGGMVAAAWAAAHPDEVAGCVLVSSSLRPHSPWHRRLRPAAWPTLARLAWGWNGPNMSATVLALTSQRAADHAALLPAWRACTAQRPVSRANALRQLLAAARTTLPVPPPVPALLLAARQDRLVHWRCSADLAAAWPGARLRLHDTAGHDLPLDDGAWVAAQAEAWARGAGLIGNTV